MRAASPPRNLALTVPRYHDHGRCQQWGCRESAAGTENSLIGTKSRVAEKTVLGADAVRDDFFQVILGFGHDIQSRPSNHLLESASVPFCSRVLPGGIGSGDGMKRSVGFEPFRKLPAHKLEPLIGNDFSGWAENSEPQSAVRSADSPSSLVLQNAGLVEKCSPVDVGTFLVRSWLSTKKRSIPIVWLKSADGGIADFQGADGVFVL